MELKPEPAGPELFDRAEIVFLLVLFSHFMWSFEKLPGFITVKQFYYRTVLVLIFEFLTIRISGTST